MKMSIFALFIALIPSVVLSSITIPDPVTVHLSEAFFIAINHKWFPEFSYGDELEYSASLLDMPDLPNWMFCNHPTNKSEAYLYGSAKELGNIQIEIVALNKHTYETSQKILNLKIESRQNLAQHEVEMKFLNVNVEDMFRSDKLQRLIELFKSDLWRESKEIYVTKVVSSLDVGGRLPLNPREKEGVVVRVGGPYAFSQDLEDLDREVTPLRNRSPCPRNYKKTSVERLFRSRSLVTDWCSFRLVSQGNLGSPESSNEHSEHSFSSVSLMSEDFSPQSNNFPRRDFVFDFIVSIIIPSAIVGILSTSLTCIMCCSRDRVEKKGDSTSMQLDHYKFIQRGSAQNPRLLGKRDSLGSTPTSSFPCSRAPSPTLTMLKGGQLRPSSRTGTLRNLMHPAPPPYTSTTLGSRRSMLT